MPHDIGCMFWHGDVPWHGLGHELPQPATLDEALKHGELDWTVSLVPLRTEEPLSDRVPQRCAVVRDDRPPGSQGRVLGVVHPNFRPLQNREGAELFHRLLDLGDRRYHTGGHLKDGQVVWLLARLPHVIDIDKRDAVETYLLYTNSHDGSIGIDIRLTTVRVVCRNTLTLALAGHRLPRLRLAHRGDAAWVEREAKAFFLATRASVERAQTTFRRLAVRPCDDAAFERFLRKVIRDPIGVPSTAPASLGRRDAYAAMLARWRAQIADVRRLGLPERDVPPDAATWWGAVNAVTGWVDHRQGVASRRYVNAMFGAGDRLKRRALELATDEAGVANT